MGKMAVFLTLIHSPLSAAVCLQSLSVKGEITVRGWARVSRFRKGKQFWVEMIELSV